jgi:hypothetical protein
LGKRKNRNSKGRFVSRAEAKAQRDMRKSARENKALAKAQQDRVIHTEKNRPTKTFKGPVPKKYRTNLGGKVPTRPNTKAMERLIERRRSKIVQGVVPKPDLHEKLQSSTGIKSQISYYRYEGVENETLVRAHLELYPSNRTVLTRISIGLGYGRDSDWMGSKLDLPVWTRAFLDLWKTRPSGKAILEAAKLLGKSIWYEIEVVTYGWKKRKFGEESRNRKSKKKPARRNKRSGRPSSRNVEARKKRVRKQSGKSGKKNLRIRRFYKIARLKK